MASSEENSGGRTTSHPENLQNAEQWNQMLEQIRRHQEAQISQLLESVRTQGLAIVCNHDGTFTVDADIEANSLPRHADYHRIPCSLSCGTANGLSIPRPITQPVSQPLQLGTPQQSDLGQPAPGASQVSPPGLNQFAFAPQLGRGQFTTLQSQSGLGHQSGIGQFSTSQPHQISTPQQSDLGQPAPGASQVSPLGFNQFAFAPQLGRGQFTTSQPQSGSDHQLGMGQFATSQAQQFDMAPQAILGQFASQVPRFGRGQLASVNSQGPLPPLILQAHMGYQDFITTSSGSSYSQHPPSSTSPLQLGSPTRPNGPHPILHPAVTQAAPAHQVQYAHYSSSHVPQCGQDTFNPTFTVPQTSYHQQPFRSALTTAWYPAITSHISSSSAAARPYEAPYKSHHPRSFGPYSYASSSTYEEGYGHAFNAQTVIPPARVLYTVVSFANANLVAGSCSSSVPIDSFEGILAEPIKEIQEKPSNESINDRSTRAIPPYQSRVSDTQEFYTKSNLDAYIDGYIKRVRAQGNTTGLNMSHRYKPYPSNTAATSSKGKKTLCTIDGIQKEPRNSGPLRQRKHFDDFGIPMGLIFKALVKEGLLEPLRDYHPRSSNAPLDMSKHCTFHSHYGHTTHNCTALKRAVQGLIEVGKLERSNGPKPETSVQNGDQVDDQDSNPTTKSS